MCNSVGTIDSGYRGEWQAKFYIQNAGTSTYQIGDKVCQAILKKTEPTEYVEVTELNDSERGTGGFGSTDAQKES